MLKHERVVKEVRRQMHDKKVTDSCQLLGLSIRCFLHTVNMTVLGVTAIKHNHNNIN